MRYGITFNGMDPLEVMLGYAMLAEDSGLDSIWMAEHFCWRDAVTCCTAFLTSTRRITVVPTALSPYARHPMLIAMSAATMEELSPGRLKLLLGTGEPTAMGEIGLAVRRPLRTMREAVEITRELLKGDFVHYEGQVFNIKGAKMGFSPRRRVPILMAAIGPKMLRLAGAIADGVALSAGCSVDYYRWAIDRVGEGAKGAGRDLKQIEVSAFVMASVADERAEAVDASKARLAYLLRSDAVNPSLDVTGTKVDKAGLKEAIGRRDWAAAKKLVSDDLVELFTASGEPDECLEKLDRFAAAGLDLLVLRPTGADKSWRRLIELIRNR